MHRQGLAAFPGFGRVWICHLVLLWSALSAPVFGEVPTPSAFRVVGYLPDYRFPGFDPSASEALTDLILFSAEITEQGGLDLGRMGQVPWARFHEFKAKTKTRLWLAVGGWGRSRHFGKVATDASLRTAFANAALQACDEHQLDGIDLDWEHPSNPAEEEGYGLLVEEMRRVMAPRGLQLSVTVAGWQKLTSRVIQFADLVQLMAYDQPGAHATFEGALADVTKLLKLGVPRSKLVLGLPFYGRHKTQRDRTPTYREIVERFKPGPEVNEVDGVYFNGPAMITQKFDHAVGEGMAGVMLWEIGQDASGEDALLKILARLKTGARSVVMAEGRRIAAHAFRVLSSELMGALTKGGPTNAIGFCSTRALDLTALVGRTNHVSLSRISHAPRNPTNAAVGQELVWIRQFQTELNSQTGLAGAVPAPLIRTNSAGFPVFYAPIVLASPLCLQCHGRPGVDIAPGTVDALHRLYPGDRATGFQLGDVRGLWKVEFKSWP